MVFVCACIFACDGWLHVVTTILLFSYYSCELTGRERLLGRLNPALLSSFPRIRFWRSRLDRTFSGQDR